MFFLSFRAIYHTIAGHIALKQNTPFNHFSSFWWFEPVRWFEGSVKAGKLPNEYNWPLPTRLVKWIRYRISCCRKCRRRRGGSSSTGGGSSKDGSGSLLLGGGSTSERKRRKGSSSKIGRTSFKSEVRALVKKAAAS